MVVLNNPPVPGKVTRNNKSFVRFWPEDGYSSYGPVFSINTVDMKHHADFTMWHFRLGKKEIAPHRYIILKARIPTVKNRRLHLLRSSKECATPILVMGSVMGLLFPLGNGAFLMTPLVNPGYRNWVFKYLWAWLRQTPTIFRVGGNLASV